MKACNAVIVTGAGSGIGRATACELGRRGYAVGLIGRRESGLRVTSRLLSANGCPSDLALANVADERDTKRAVQTLAKSLGPLVGAVANAGAGGPNKRGLRDRWHQLIDTNLTGTYNTFNAALKYMPAGVCPGARLIAISSVLARIGISGYTGYCASKAGIHGLVRALAAELASRRITVSVVCPGWVDTRMSRNGIRRRARQRGVSEKKERQDALAAVPLERMSSPEEIASVVAFLFTETGYGFTGQSIDVNNGAWMVP